MGSRTGVSYLWALLHSWGYVAFGITRSSQGCKTLEVKPGACGKPEGSDFHCFPGFQDWEFPLLSLNAPCVTCVVLSGLVLSEHFQVLHTQYSAMSLHFKPDSSLWCETWNRSSAQGRACPLLCHTHQWLPITSCTISLPGPKAMVEFQPPPRHRNRTLWIIAALYSL